MTAVFVHGVPETPALWKPLIGNLTRTDLLTPALPGFLTDRPLGFDASMDEYAAWLIGELEAIGGPVDLVGHDWGGGFTVRVGEPAPRPRAVVGHRRRGSRRRATSSGTRSPRSGRRRARARHSGKACSRHRPPIVPRASPAAACREDDALVAAEALNPSMASCILDLYRSATKVQDAWGPDFVDIPKPGMVIVPLEDAFLNADGAKSAAKKAGARVTELSGLGHWWMLQDPVRGAAVLEEFWDSV